MAGFSSCLPIRWLFTELFNCLLLETFLCLLLSKRSSRVTRSAVSGQRSRGEISKSLYLSTKVQGNLEFQEMEEGYVTPFWEEMAKSHVTVHLVFSGAVYNRIGVSDSKTMAALFRKVLDTSAFSTTLNVNFIFNLSCEMVDLLEYEIFSRGFLPWPFDRTRVRFASATKGRCSCDSWRPLLAPW